MSTFRPGGGPRGGKGFRPPQTPDQHRINHRITAREVRLIDEKGEQLGVILTREALAMAEARDLDLVEVAGQANPPVCRLMDYGKFKYKEQKKEAEAKKKRTENVIKEIRLRYRTDVGDLDTKLRQARGFIEDGDKVKFSMHFKGREVVYQNLGAEKFNDVIERLKDIAVVDDRGPLRGRQMYIVFAPIKKT